ncbi:MAG: prepilin-type N-terminal cleavage/methylation domain-containing protein [Bdellovibrionales bacterium]|nr:prepilin-type N-terminal cleavage/methylation domain-containing protein [Bdellovibrionales bacterium]
MRLTSTISSRRATRIAKSESGFTLIEVLISLFILTLIGITTGKAVLDAGQLKEILKAETEFANEVRTSMSFIERDLSQTFNPRWFLPANQKPLDPYNQAAPNRTGTNANLPKTLSNDEINRYLKGTAFQQFEYWGMVYDQTGIRPARFQGKVDSMSFIAASHFRIYQQKKESIYAKVRYELQKQPANPNLTNQENEKLAGLQQLIKIENTRAFDMEEPKDSPSENVYVVLNNIKKFTFAYYKPDTKDPVKTWDSEAEDTKGQYPEAVEIEFSLQAPNDRTLDAKVLFKLEAPNNVLPKTY